MEIGNFVSTTLDPVGTEKLNETEIWARIKNKEDLYKLDDENGKDLYTFW